MSVRRTFAANVKVFTRPPKCNARGPLCKVHAPRGANDSASGFVLWYMIVIPRLEVRGGGLASGTAQTGGESFGGFSHPLAIARYWANLGFTRVHVVDCSGDAPGSAHGFLLEDIIRDGALNVIAGGGVHSTDQIERLADAGASRVVLDDRAIEEPRWLASMAELFPGLLVVGTDVRARRVITRGWVRSLPLDIFDVVDDLDGLPLAGLLVAADGQDQPRTASDLTLLEDIAESCAFPVMATGGVETLNDLRALEHRGVAAAVIDGARMAGELDARSLAQEYGG